MHSIQPQNGISTSIVVIPSEYTIGLCTQRAEQQSVEGKRGVRRGNTEQVFEEATEFQMPRIRAENVLMRCLLQGSTVVLTVTLSRLGDVCHYSL